MNTVRPPSVKEVSFSCPTCGAHASQTWFSVFAKERGDEHPLPMVWESDRPIPDELGKDAPEEERAEVLRFFESLKSNIPKLWRENSWESVRIHVHNVHLSQCYSCKEIALWIGQNVAFPDHVAELVPHSEMPADLRADFMEAARVVNISPRSAAALARLIVQKLMRELGENGKNVNDDIASLVQKGLQPRIQQSLDVVRVIGNNAVHPGSIDLKDDKATAATILQLINMIVDREIAEPKKISEMYEKLPESIRSAIDKRDSKDVTSTT